jgi:hypothetical protein
MIAKLLVLASAGIVLALGVLHLVYTFSGPALLPRDAALQARMREVSLVISRDTTMWKAWIGFNASHSMGAILFGLVYGYLAIAQAESLFGSAFLLCVGGAMLAGLTLLARIYWFSGPFRSVGVALVCFIAGSVAGVL